MSVPATSTDKMSVHTDKMSQILTKCQFLNIFKKSLELLKIFKKAKIWVSAF